MRVSHARDGVSGNFVLSVRTGNLVYTAGHLPMDLEGKLKVGKVGKEVSVDEAYQASRLVAINILASLKGRHPHAEA